VELFKQPSVDWIGKKWIFIFASAAILIAGLIGYFARGGLAYGIDFTGGTVVYLKFRENPDLDRVRIALEDEAVGTAIIQRYGAPELNTLLIRMQRVYQAGEDVDAGQRALNQALRHAFDRENMESAKTDFNHYSVGVDLIRTRLIDADPAKLRAGGKTTQEIENQYRQVASAVVDYRNRTRDGLVPSLDDLRNAPGASGEVVESLKQSFYAGPFALKGVESVGAVVGADLRRRAGLAVGLSFLAMLVYIGFRFKPIYGVAAIIALLHDIVLTVGLFALTQKEVSLTVIAAMLTLVGYSVNDKIVIFDRVRENLRIVRKDSLYKILNLSINQMFSRTLLTGGATLLALLSLFIFGGEVLNGFSFALLVGIIIGTYSSIAIATPFVEWWYRVTDQKTGRKAA
jgi:preprotein translocase subunit SecF